MDTALPSRLNATPGDSDRRVWLLATAVAGSMAAVATAVPFISTLAPSERARAAGGSVEVDVSGLAPGDMVAVEWRGQPVWVMRRTPEMLAALHGHDAELVDPLSVKQQQPAYASNPERAIQPEFFVAIGICTHLGCSPSTAPKNGNNPSLPADWPGGFFCPCHGSTFDFAGRVYKNKPAPTNLEIPPHRYIAATRIQIGEDQA
jgi:ubiquinol-cytochrome c reductase iron-sulfur subunit